LRFIFNPFERGEIGPDPFRAACDRDPALPGRQVKAPYKVKNQKHPAMERVMEAFS
jgi:hypothetical protein